MHTLHDSYVLSIKIMSIKAVQAKINSQLLPSVPNGLVVKRRMFAGFRITTPDGRDYFVQHDRPLIDADYVAKGTIITGENLRITVQEGLDYSIGDNLLSAYEI